MKTEKVREQNRSSLANIYSKLSSLLFFKYILFLLGLPVHIVMWCIYKTKYKNTQYQQMLFNHMETIKKSSTYSELIHRYEEQYRSKKLYFHESIREQEMREEATKLANEQILKMAKVQLETTDQSNTNYQHIFAQCLQNKSFVVVSFIPGIMMYLFLLIYARPLVRYIFERLLMTVFVIISVTIFVFTILHFSPSDPAANILRESATAEQRAEFNHQYGLDQSYWVQLWDTTKGILTLDLGYSFTGNEDIMTSIANKFPITLTIAFLSLLMAIVLAIPVGMISAAKPNSFWDYTFMFVALIGLSIPNFWQGLVFILNFSIKWHILPATYSPDDWLSIIMPVVVLGTGLTASIARMTRSSILEVINEEYIVTAKAKGLKPSRVFINHALRNAIIPIITIIGLQFGGMLGGAAVTEKVFNISGLGSYIVDKQFIPDIPSILGGVVYIAITISLVNLAVDILYAFLNPRIRSQMKNT
ncbi:ABC transporter permease [Viridibacillus sp. YIM B01967]|uniref:ABC transporter permease n=1 Tax=Viridibacillus soli TaxID=2798301 RepID=A0ABS1H6U4_9BACL|nr:ABC transporter permease [Viridibacillus soli]MBK3494748.1 ABC transporter permease [Viridibacillus soli]